MDDVFDMGFEPIGAAAEKVVASVQKKLPLALGIYFDLDAETYHADPALGSSSIRELATAPELFQYKRLRPTARVETEAMQWGSAWHCRVLEGRAEFDRRYARKPSVDDYAKDAILTTSDSIKEYLKQNGLKLTGTKPELIERAKTVPGCPAIFDEILSEWMRAHPDHIDLTAEQVLQIEDAVANMERDPTLAAVMKAGSLVDGAAELSIIYERDGIRRKARFDYGLAPHGSRARSLICDLKSFSTFKGATNEQAAIRKIYDDAYDLQGADYLNAWDAALDLFERGRVYNQTPERMAYLEAFVRAPAVDWVWIMIRRDRGLIPVVCSVAANDPMMVAAAATVDAALETYRQYMATWGPDKLWTPPARKPIRLNASMMPTYPRGVLHEHPAS